MITNSLCSSRHFIAALIIVAATASNSCKRDALYGDIVETVSPRLQAHDVAIGENIAGYYSGFPQRYDLTPETKTYPLILTLQGAGGYGNGGSELDRVLSGIIGILKDKDRFPPTLTVNGTNFSFIILAPQFRKYATTKEIDSFLEFAKRRYRIDTSRVYLSGLSLGGRMAGDYAAEYPNKIAALLTMGGCPSQNVYDKCVRLAGGNVPVWSFHNQDDIVWPVQDTRRFIETLKSLQPVYTPRMTIFEIPEGEANHNAWGRPSSPTYKEDGRSIYEWMLQFKK